MEKQSLIYLNCYISNERVSHKRMHCSQPQTNTWLEAETRRLRQRIPRQRLGGRGGCELSVPPDSYANLGLDLTLKIKEK